MKKYTAITFERWLADMEPMLEYIKFKIKVYDNTPTKHTVHGEDLSKCIIVTPTFPKRFVDYLKQNNTTIVKSKIDSIQYRLGYGELIPIYNQFKKIIDRQEAIDEILKDL